MAKMMPQTAYPIRRGCPGPLGISQKADAVNFAIFSKQAKTAKLFLYAPGGKTPFLEAALDPKINRTGFIWHIAIEKLPAVFDYGFSFSPKSVVSDPYAKELNTTAIWGDEFYNSHQILGRWHKQPPFDWQNDEAPEIPFQDLILYEMHVRGFTQDPSSHVKHPGTYLGLIEKIPHLKELGVNAVELLPVFEFNERENGLKNPKTGKKLFNYWGYSTVNFFSPMKRFSSSENAISEFKTMVRELHKNKIEVILDVVYNHTAEGNEKGRTFSFRGIDNASYYMLGAHGEYLNFSGCGNTFNANNPIAANLIVDSLKYWASEMHVDGFRFDLASILTRGPNGAPLSNPPVIEAICNDPVLADCKLIAEAWDAGGLYQVGSFPSHRRFAEWNGKYRDVVRKFIKGTSGCAGDFSKAASGSQELYAHDGRKPYHSVNFVTAHDGFSLYDLVSYNSKHNFENGEENRDGANDNESWNCGAEGPTNNLKVLQLRKRQIRNFHLALMVSIGVPMILMGDEYAAARGGNNNTWGHDGPLNWFLWNELDRQADFFRFYKRLIAFRKQEPLLRRSEFLSESDVDWHGLMPFKANWGEESRFVAYTLKDGVKQEHVYIAFNAGSGRASVQLPDPPPHKKWYRIVDTALNPPNDFIDDAQNRPPLKGSYPMEAYSSLIAKAL